MECVLRRTWQTRAGHLHRRRTITTLAMVRAHISALLVTARSKTRRRRTMGPQPLQAVQNLWLSSRRVRLRGFRMMPPFHRRQVQRHLRPCSTRKQKVLRFARRQALITRHRGQSQEQASTFRLNPFKMAEGLLMTIPLTMLEMAYKTSHKSRSHRNNVEVFSTLSLTSPDALELLAGLQVRSRIGISTGRPP